MRPLDLFRIGAAIFLIGVFFIAGPWPKMPEAQEGAGASNLQVSVPLKVKEDVRISMDLKDANIKDVLKILSQQAGLNFVASDEIQDKQLTLYLDQVTVTDALTNIVSANHLEYVQVPGSNIFLLRKKGAEEGGTLTKIYKLKYARVSTSALEIGASNVVLEAGTRASLAGLSGSASGSSVSGGGGAGGGKKNLRGLDLILEKLVTEKGSVVTDPRTNSLIVTDIPSQFKAIDEAVAKLDRPVPQVLIEAEILETSANLAKKLGAQWGDATSGQILSATASSAVGDFPFNFKTETPTGVSAPSSLTLGSLNAANLGLVLSVLHSNTDTKILARPRVLVLDNEGAVIDLTSDTAIASVTSVAQTSGGLATQAQNTAERTQTGVSLRVTPQVNDNGYVTMFVEPAVVSAAASKFFSSFVDPQTRAARTTVMVKDGNTLVIGGLINTEDTEVDRKVPLLGDIPILGLAFRKKTVDRTDKEVIVFLTPHIVRVSETPFSQEVLESDQPVTVQVPTQAEEREVVPPRSKEEEINTILDQLSSQPAE